MKTVWKYLLQVGRVNIIGVPAQARVVLAAIDPVSGSPAIWIETEPPVVGRGLGSEPMGDDVIKEARRFVVRGTGAEIDEGEVHVGSMIDRAFVWHIYERRD
jgi:hypothetical protein